MNTYSTCFHGKKKFSMFGLTYLRVFIFNRPLWLIWVRVPLVIRRLQVGHPPSRKYSFVESDHKIFSTVILSLPCIREGQLSVSGEKMCTILVNRLED